MNRYIAAGVLDDMRKGRRVLVLSHTQHEARHAFAEVTTSALPGETVRRANGEERITACDNRGWVAFGTSGGNGFRGFPVDVVVLDAHEPSMAAIENIVPALAASEVGELIRS